MLWNNLSNRKYLPNNLKRDKDLAFGEFDYDMLNQDVALFKWMDTKAVYLIFNFHGSEREVVQHKSASIKMLKSPKAISDYNKNMGGVNKTNFYCSLWFESEKCEIVAQVIFWPHRQSFDKCICYIL